MLPSPSDGYDPYHAYPSARSGSSVSVISHQHGSETATLLPRKVQRKHEGMSASRLFQVICWCLALFFLLTVYCTLMHFLRCPLDPSTRDAIRQDWKEEESQHTFLEREWQRKTQEHAEIERGWERTSERRIREEHVRQARVREEWTRETERHVREFEEMQRREREEREQERQSWRREVEEREQREEKERQKFNMFWGHVEAHTCATYATREYTAQLMNLPATWEHRVEACKATPLEVHGISYLPKSCEDKGPGVVIGRWEIDQEPDCRTIWEGYSDKGCTSPGSGERHITYKLMNLPEGSDWREFCATTPNRFNHMQFLGAKECFKTVFGVYGQWEVDDTSC